MHFISPRACVLVTTDTDPCEDTNLDTSVGHSYCHCAAAVCLACWGVQGPDRMPSLHHLDGRLYILTDRHAHILQLLHMCNIHLGDRCKENAVSLSLPLHLNVLCIVCCLCAGCPSVTYRPLDEFLLRWEFRACRPSHFGFTLPSAIGRKTYMTASSAARDTSSFDQKNILSDEVIEGMCRLSIRAITRISCS